MKRVSVALLLLGALRPLLRSEAEPGLGKVGREAGYTYRYATRRR